MEIPHKVEEEDANTWVATDYWTQYGTKIGASDLFFLEPIHMIMAWYLQQYDGPEGAAIKGHFRFQDIGEWGITIREYYTDGSLYCEHRLYVKEKK